MTFSPPVQLEMVRFDEQGAFIERLTLDVAAIQVEQQACLDQVGTVYDGYARYQPVGMQTEWRVTECDAFWVRPSSRDGYVALRLPRESRSALRFIGLSYQFQEETRRGQVSRTHTFLSVSPENFPWRRRWRAGFWPWEEMQMPEEANDLWAALGATEAKVAALESALAATNDALADAVRRLQRRRRVRHSCAECGIPLVPVAWQCAFCEDLPADLVQNTLTPDEAAQRLRSWEDEEDQED